MKNTRKKMLLSSVAMLLVALVALGSATYAWFVANPDATASGIKLKTTAAAGLVVKTDSDSRWSHGAKFYNTAGATDVFNLNPASESQTVGEADDFWTVEAAKADEYAAAAKAMTPATKGGYASFGATLTTSGDVYREKVYFKLSDGSDASAAASQKVYLHGVTINTVDNANMSDAIRVTVADESGKILGTYAPSTTGANKTITTASRTEAEFSPALATTVASDIKVSDDALSAADNTDTYVTVYVWLDGQDSACYSEHVGTVDASQFISSISVDFTLK